MVHQEDAQLEAFIEPQFNSVIECSIKTLGTTTGLNSLAEAEDLNCSRNSSKRLVTLFFTVTTILNRKFAPLTNIIEALTLNKGYIWSILEAHIDFFMEQQQKKTSKLWAAEMSFQCLINPRRGTLKWCVILLFF